MHRAEDKGADDSIQGTTGHLVQVFSCSYEELLVGNVLVLVDASQKALLEVGVDVGAGDFAAWWVELEVSTAAGPDLQQLQLS